MLETWGKNPIFCLYLQSQILLFPGTLTWVLLPSFDRPPRVSFRDVCVMWTTCTYLQCRAEICDDSGSGKPETVVVVLKKESTSCRVALPLTSLTQDAQNGLKPRKQELQRFRLIPQFLCVCKMSRFSSRNLCSCFLNFKCDGSVQKVSCQSVVCYQ